MVDRYLVLTIDTEALPARASDNHVRKLVWGEHEKGSAGLREFVGLSQAHNAPFTFFVEVARSLWEPAEHREYFTWLIRHGQDLQLHFHPEIFKTKDLIDLPLTYRPGRQDRWTDEEAESMLDWAIRRFENFTGKAPIAYRAGSFRWNQATINAMSRLGMQLSFNNCYEAKSKADNESPATLERKFSTWPEGIIEVPCTESYINDELVHLSFPRRFPVKQGLRGYCEHLMKTEASPVVFNLLLHSWSLLSRDQSTGQFYYEDNRRLDNVDKFLCWAKTEFEIISATELSGLIKDGRLKPEEYV